MDTYVVEDCVIDDVGNGGLVIYGSTSPPPTNGIIRRNTISNLASNDAITLHDNSAGDRIGPDHQILNNVCFGAPEQGFDITSGSRIFLQGNESYGNLDDIAVGHGVVDIHIDGHYGHDNRRHGIILASSSGVTNLVLTNSLIVSNGTGYALLAERITNLRISHNAIIHGPDSTGSALLQLGAETRNVRVRNNIFASTQNAPGSYVRFVGANDVTISGSEFSHNTWWRPDGVRTDMWDGQDFETWTDVPNQGEASRVAAPMFVDVDGGDYHLRDDSPCIDVAGEDERVTVDHEGTPRPQGPASDIGAYEFTRVAPSNDAGV